MSVNKQSNVVLSHRENRVPIELGQLDVFIEDNQSSRKEDDVRKWADDIVEKVKEARQSGQKTNMLVFSHDNFPPNYIVHYKELQERIAAVIPNEYERPTIELEIRGNNRPYKDSNQNECFGDKPDLGLLGGTGPLSDAHIINKIIAKNEGQLDNIYIKLRSAPPPRAEERAISIKDWLSHLWNYTWGVNSLGSSQCNHYAMLSNTAHSNAGNFQKMLDRPERLVHLVNFIAQSVADDHPRNVLVLGTMDAAQKRLYPNALKQLNTEGVLPDMDQQIKLQAYIDHVKSGTLTPELGGQFLQFIFNEIEKVANKQPGDPSHVILGCTEIPLFLETKFIDPETKKEKTYHDLLTEKMQNHDVLKNVKIKFVDSEDAMVTILDKHQKKIASNKSDAMFNKINPKAALSQEGDDFFNFKAAVCQGIKKYIKTMDGFLNLIFGLNEKEVKIANDLLDHIVSSTSASELKSHLEVFFHNNTEKLNDSSLKTNILESILGSLSKEQRTSYANDLSLGNFSSLEKSFLDLQASATLQNSANIKPSDIPLKSDHSVDDGCKPAALRI